MAVLNEEIEVTAVRARELIREVARKLDVMQTEFDQCSEEGADDLSRLLGEMSHDLEQAASYFTPEEPEKASDSKSIIKRAVMAVRAGG